jgi:mannose-6-phosphate isomerase-like protein (cupin superfamily)
VLLDGKNTGNRAASMFELIVPAGTTLAATASERTEVWFALSGPGAGNATFLPPGAARAPAAPADAPLRVLIVSVPGGDEDATRSAAVLPASPANLKDKKRPKAKVIRAADVAPIPRTGGSVQILVEKATTGSDALSASLLAFDAGTAIPAHVHDGSTELLFVRKGRATMVVDGVTLDVGPESVVQIPAGVEHSATISEAFEAIQLYTPAGPEQRFKAAK